MTSWIYVYHHAGENDDHDEGDHHHPDEEDDEHHAAEDDDEHHAAEEASLFGCANVLLTKSYVV